MEAKSFKNYVDQKDKLAEADWSAFNTNVKQAGSGALDAVKQAGKGAWGAVTSLFKPAPIDKVYQQAARWAGDAEINKPYGEKGKEQDLKTALEPFHQWTMARAAAQNGQMPQEVQPSTATASTTANAAQSTSQPNPVGTYVNSKNAVAAAAKPPLPVTPGAPTTPTPPVTVTTPNALGYEPTHDETEKMAHQIYNSPDKTGSPGGDWELSQKRLRQPPQSINVHAWYAPDGTLIRERRRLK